MTLCLKLMLALHLATIDGEIEKMEAIMHRAFSEDSTTLDYANAALMLPEFEAALKRSKVRVLEWVEDAPRGDVLYAALQRIKKGRMTK